VDRDDQLEVHKDEAADGAPIVDDSPPRRRRRLAIIAAGTLTGLVLGGLVVLLVDAPRATGSGDNPAVWVFGLPGFLAIAGTVIGWVAAGLPSVEVVDAPVRQRRFRRAGRAATSEQGQLPASDVPPRYAPTPRDHHPTRQP
jgi:hypothetical protein